MLAFPPAAAEAWPESLLPRKLINGSVFTKRLLGHSRGLLGTCPPQSRDIFQVHSAYGLLLVTQAWGRGVAGKARFCPVAPRDWFGDRREVKCSIGGMVLGGGEQARDSTGPFLHVLLTREMFPEPSSGVPGNG